MKMETNDAVKNIGLGDVDRNLSRKARNDVGDAFDAVSEQQDLLRLEAAACQMGLSQHPQHDGTFGNEAVLPAGQVALADGAEFRDARVIRTLDRDQRRSHCR